jgi:hypothetical protein
VPLKESLGSASGELPSSDDAEGTGSASNSGSAVLTKR